MKTALFRHENCVEHLVIEELESELQSDVALDWEDRFKFQVSPLCPGTTSTWCYLVQCERN